MIIGWCVEKANFRRSIDPWGDKDTFCGFLLKACLVFKTGHVSLLSQSSIQIPKGTHSVPYAAFQKKPETNIILKTAVFDSADSRTKLLPILATGLAFTYLISGIPAMTGTETEPATPQANVTPSHALQTPQDFSLISDFHLFGQSSSASTSASATGVPPETTQQLHLKGVLYLPDKHAYAIIESSDQHQKTYKINDTLPGGAILQAIESNSIVILADNRQESLILTKTKQEQPATADMQPELQSANEEQTTPESANEIVIQPPESLSTY
jgi:type II secretory pathway component PulC